MRKMHISKRIKGIATLATPSLFTRSLYDPNTHSIIFI